MTKQEDMPLLFGKHKGELIADVPDSYLSWLLDQDWFCRDFARLKVQIDIELAFRKKFNIEVD